MDDFRELPEREPLRGGDFHAVSEEAFVEREAEQRRMGRIAQDVAFESEKTRLRDAGHQNPDDVVRPVWDEPARGYDIASVELDGTPRPIEVKSARLSAETVTFFVSDNEVRKSRQLPNYFSYLVLNADSPDRDVIQIPGRDLVVDHLLPVTYRASVPIVVT